MWLYSILLIASVSVPLLLSFDKKLQFYKQWKYVFPSIAVIAAVYIGCDVYLTEIGVWGFNPRYYLNILLFNLPVEEWLFFILIPYASIFLHESLLLYFPDLKTGKTATRAITIFLILFLTVIILFHSDKIYTVYIFSFLIASLVISLFDKSSVISHFYISFLLILIPFIAVNAVLTGSFIEEEVVWYNNQENLGIRFMTIPIEDFGYAFSMILLNLLVIGRLKRAGMKPAKV